MLCLFAHRNDFEAYGNVFTHLVRMRQIFSNLDKHKLQWIEVFQPRDGILTCFLWAKARLCGYLEINLGVVCKNDLT